MRLVATLGRNGRLTLPAAVRRALGVEAGDKLSFRRLSDGSFALRAETPRFGESAAGVVRLRFEAADLNDRKTVRRAEQARRGLQALRGGAIGEEPY